MPVTTIVIGVNILIALLGFYAAWRLWRFKETLGNIADALLDWERHAHNGLNLDTTPGRFLQGQQNAARLRQQYARFQVQLNQLQQILMLVRFFSVTGRWVRRFYRMKSTSK